jgi:hypothetical protein
MRERGAGGALHREGSRPPRNKTQYVRAIGRITRTSVPYGIPLF